MSTYTVRVNGRHSLTTESVPELLACTHDLRSAAGPVSVEEDGKELTALDFEELALAYHAGTTARVTAALPTETVESLLAEAADLEQRAARKARLVDSLVAAGRITDEGLCRDINIFREEAAGKRRRAARLSGVASY